MGRVPWAPIGYCSGYALQPQPFDLDWFLLGAAATLLFSAALRVLTLSYETEDEDLELAFGVEIKE